MYLRILLAVKIIKSKIDLTNGLYKYIFYRTIINQYF
jgi:hypothetical protein